MLEQQPVAVADDAVPRREQRSFGERRRRHQQNQRQLQQHEQQPSITIAKSDLSSPLTSTVKSSISRVISVNTTSSFVVDKANVARTL